MNTLQVAEIIKKMCKIKGITIKEMLEQCNINRNFMYDLKNNKIPSTDKLESIADYFNCSVDYILGRTENPNINNSINIKTQNIKIGQIGDNNNVNF